MNIIHKSSYLSNFVEKFTVKVQLQYSIQHHLHKNYCITVDYSVTKHFMRNSGIPVTNDSSEQDNLDYIEPLVANRVAESDLILASNIL